ncbi:MAG: hypothetical protein IKK52_01540 [Alphaproteobacteria bacterium]|nr:hypothetical protein [Alphaproteobacteria bacterium]
MAKKETKISKNDIEKRARTCRAKMNRAGYLKTLITTAALGVATLLPVTVKAAERHSNDGKNSQTTELTTDTNFYNFPASLRPNDQGYFDFEDVQKMALEMYAQSINNYLEAYIAEATADVAAINEAKKQGKNYNQAISKAIEKSRINNLRQHCAEAGSWEVFNQKFTPQFLIDSVYNNLKNPNFAPTIINDLKRIAKKYCEKPNQFFMEDNGNIYKKITDYNKRHNPNNDKKLFLCEETNDGGRHFTMLYFDGTDYWRVSFNKEDVRSVKDYKFAQSRKGHVVDVTGIFASYVNHELCSLKKYNNKISRKDATQFMEKFSKCLSSDTYYVNSYDQLAELESMKNNKLAYDTKPDGINISFLKISKEEFTNLAVADTHTVAPYISKLEFDIPISKNHPPSIPFSPASNNRPQKSSVEQDIPRQAVIGGGRRRSQYSIS